MKPSAAPAQTSSLRPRVRRLISGLDDDSDSSAGAAAAASTGRATPSMSPFNSRAHSPIPNPRLTRSTSSSQTIPRSQPQDGANSRLLGGGNDAMPTLTDLWGTSWSTLQGLASNVLGNDPPDGPNGGQGGGASSRKRRPMESTHRRRSGILSSTTEWGPTPAKSADIGVGSREEREAMVRAMKRKDLLNANGHIYADSIGRIKRRNSDDRSAGFSSSAPPGEYDDRDALVYVHRVRPQDTLAGLTIRFNCQADILRKANRMWPNDLIQARDVIVVPVDACTVKGRPVPGPSAEEDDLLLDCVDESRNKGDKADALTNGGGPSPLAAAAGPQRRARSSTMSTAATDSEPPWRHDSWVLFPNETAPVEIARMSRRELGFFPPARRKSGTFSDRSAGPSLDLTRVSPRTPSSPIRTHHRSALSRDLSSRPSTAGSGASSPRAPGSTTPTTRTRPRAASRKSFILQGPGGVGTFGRNVRKPGPAQDGLNKLLAPHLPNVNPPPSQQVFTPWGPTLLDQDGQQQAGSRGVSGAVSASKAGGGGGGFDLENVGGAIEGWLRKAASKATTYLNDGTPSGKSVRPPGSGLGVPGSGVGDLIELRDDAFEIGDGAEDLDAARMRADDAARGRAAEATSGRSGAPSGVRTRGKAGGGGSKKGGKGD